jgi:F5/8 type C domain
MRERWVAVAMLVLAAGVRVLRFWGVISWAHRDEANVAVPAIQVLGGTFPVHHVGVEYVGATAAYPLAAWFNLAGVSTTALDLFTYVVGLGVAWTGFLVARRVLPSSAALLAFAVLAVPPLLLAYWAISGTLNPPMTLLIGNLILLGTHTAFFRRPGWSAPLFIVGLLAGVGWWMYPLVVVYWAPFAILALRTGLFRRARFWLFPLGVAVGGLPDWIYEVLHYPTARLMVHQAGSLPAESIGVRATQLFADIVPQLFGAKGMDGFVPPLAVQVGVMALGVLALARAVMRDGPELRWLAGADGQRGQGLSLLWGVAVANLGLVLFTQRTLGANYLLPLYSVLPIWLGECLWWLWGRRRWLGAGALAGWFAFQLWSNWAVTLGRERPMPRWANLNATVRPVAEWLTARGIRRVYWAPDSSIASYEFSYLTGMRVIAADLWAESVIQHAHAVDAEDAPPLVTTASRLGEVRASLRGLGLDLRETLVGGFVVLETRPARPMGFASIPPTGWTLTASHRAHEVRHLLDRDAGTGWSIGDRQAPGQWLAVDLGREEDVARVDLLAIDWKEVPAAFHVEWSRDGVCWETAVSVPHYWGPIFWSERHAFLKVRRGRVQAIFEPVRARFLRVTLDQSGPQAWAARELFVYRPGPPSTAVLEAGELTAALRREGVRFVYANPWLSARVRVESRESIGALESNSAVNSYGRSEPEPSLLERFRLQSDRAVLLGSDADAAEVRQVLAVRGGIAREREAGPYRLLVLAPEAPRRPLARAGWRGSASVAAGTAGRAVDGDPRTRWTADGPVDPTASFTLELDRPRRLTGFRLVPGSREGGPAEFVLEGSTDARAWQPLEPRTWAGPLFWTGAELLRNSRPEWAVTFPPATVRYVRIRPAAPAPTWTIAEITAFE